MRVLTIFAHHNPHSFCHALLERFTAGVLAAGHTHEVVDLHAIGFDPVLSDLDAPNWIDDGVPDDVLANMRVERSLLASATNPVQRWLVKRWIGKADARGIIRKIRARGGPPDVAEQQAKVARADALVFISPIYFMGFPAILKGWIDRVFSLGFAFGFSPEGWRGDLSGRVPLLTIKKALILSTTIFDEAAYQEGHAAAIKKLVEDYCLRYPGVAQVEHEYFHAVHGVDDATRDRYLARAYRLGRDLFSPELSASPRRPSLAATADVARKLERRSLANLSRMGHCAPTIMQTMLDVSETEGEWLVNLCAGLPGGIANLGEECGGVTAPLVLLGLRYGLEPGQGELPRIVDKGHDLLHRFADSHGSTSCREIRAHKRLPLACVNVVRHSPSRCAETMCGSCSEALTSDQRSAYELVYRDWQKEGFHCAHSVIRALADRIEVQDRLIDATAGFLGGTVFCGRTCSALTAGVMALGLLADTRENSRMRVARMIATMAVGGDAFRDELNEFSRVMNGTASNPRLDGESVRFDLKKAFQICADDCRPRTRVPRHGRSVLRAMLPLREAAHGLRVATVSRGLER